MGGVGADEQGEGALGRDGPGGSLGQPGDLVVKYGLGRTRQQVGQGGGLGADLIDRQAQLIDADQDGDGREDGQKGEEGNAPRVEHDVPAPAAGEGAHGQTAPEAGRLQNRSGQLIAQSGPHNRYNKPLNLKDSGTGKSPVDAPAFGGGLRRR